MKLSDAVELIIDNRGKTPPIIKTDGIPLIEAQTYVDSFEYVNIKNCKKYVTEEVYNNWFRNGHPKKDDLLITLVGDLGSCCLVGNEKCCIAQNIIAIRFKKDFNPKYIYYLFQTSYYKKSIKALNRSSVQPSILVDDLLNLELIVPLKNEQDKVVKILDNLDNIINNSIHLNEQIDYLEQIIYDNLMKSKDTSDMIIDDLITIDRGISYSSNELVGNRGISMISLNSFLPTNSYKINGEKYFSGKYSSQKSLNPLDLLMCVTQQTAIDLVYDTDVIGKVFLLPNIYKTDVVCTMDVVRLLPKKQSIKFYLYMFFKQKYFHKYISSFANGTKIKHLDCNGLLNLHIKVPGDNKLIEFNKNILILETLKSNSIKEMNELIKTRDNLLLMLMNGQIKIED